MLCILEGSVFERVVMLSFYLSLRNIDLIKILYIVDENLLGV